MKKYYRSGEYAFLVLTPDKQVYSHGKLVPELVCGRGPDEWGFIKDQVYRVADLGEEADPSEIYDWAKDMLDGSEVHDDYTARFIARVLVGFIVGAFIGWLFFG